MIFSSNFNGRETLRLQGRKRWTYCAEAAGTSTSSWLPTAFDAVTKRMFLRCSKQSVGKIAL